MKFNLSIEQILGWVVPDLEACRLAAAEMRLKSPDATPEQLAQEVITYARRQGVTIGGVTGAASSPITMLPAALADVAATLKVEGTMAGTIAALLDPDALDDVAIFRADVVSIVFPGAVSQALRQLGIHAGQQLTKSLIRRAASKGVFESILKYVSKLLGSRITGKALLGKDVPLIGVGIGMGWNWFEVGAVGARAVRYYTGQPMGSPMAKRLRDAPAAQKMLKFMKRLP